MNETQLIRRQLGIERAHALAVARTAAGAAGEPLRAPLLQAADAYLACVLGWYEARDERLARLAAGLGAQDPRCNTVNQILARRGSSAEARALLAGIGGPGDGWDELAQYLASYWSPRCDALEQLLGNDARAADWRLISGIDADAILEERTRFARVTRLLPTGAGLLASTQAP